MADATFPDLRSFLDRLRRDGDLAVVEAEVDARLEVAEIHRRVIAAGGPALLFTRVRGAGYPLVTNLFGPARDKTGSLVGSAASDRNSATARATSASRRRGPARAHG